MLALFSGYGFLMGAAWSVFSTIPREATDFYGVGEVAVSMFELSFMIAFVLTCVPASWLLARSLQRTLQGTVLLMGLGAVLRFGAWDHYALALTGQCLIALGNAVALSAGPVLAEFWFPQHQAVLATAIASLAAGVGSSLQLLISSLLRSIPLLLGIQVTLCLLETLLVGVLFKPDPTHRESSVAYSDLKQYVQRGKAMGFLLLSGATAGTVFALIGLLYTVLEPAGYSSLQTGFIGFTLSFCGMLGGVSSTLFLANSRFSTHVMQVYLLCGIIFSLALCVAILSFPAMLVISAFYGFSALGFLPMAIREAVEDAPTVHPSVPVMIIFLTSQIVGLAQSGLAIYFQRATDLSALYLFALFTMLTMGFFLALHRMNFVSDRAAQPLKEDRVGLAKES